MRKHRQVNQQAQQTGADAQRPRTPPPLLIGTERALQVAQLSGPGFRHPGARSRPGAGLEGDHLGRHLGMDEDSILALKRGGYLHDLGKELKAGAVRARATGFALPVPPRAKVREAAAA